MMRLLVFFFAFILFNAKASNFQKDSIFQKNLGYEVLVNLNNVENDKIGVEIDILLNIEKDEIEFQMPKIVPGTYSIYDFGRFLNSFKALDSLGNNLDVERVDDNIWKIKNARSLKKIAYYADDTFDSEQDNVVFEPAGTNIEKGKNFVINSHGFFGYLDGYKNMSYKIVVDKPQEFYGATSLPLISSENNKDTYYAENYHYLVDAPIMYNKPDTASLSVGGAEILVSVYSPNNKLSSNFVKQNVEEILNAQKEYLGGVLPIKKYAFIIYLMDRMSLSGAMGALEHSYSSFYTLPEVDPGLLAQTIKDIAAHEFFHIVTPLNIHSEEIHDFNFINPKMSKHLWLYEGVTEYSAHHVQVKHGLINVDAYLDVTRDKIDNAEGFLDTVPFTEISKKCLGEFKDQYGNVYEKGALIGMCLDILLRNLSDGEYGIQNMMRDLAKFYGKDKAFKDDELFDKIAEITYPEVHDFIKTHIEGSKPLPFKELFALVGIEYVDSKKERSVTMGNIGLSYNPETGKPVIGGLDKANDFAKNIGFQEGDELISLNGKSINLENISDVIDDFKANSKEGDDVKIEVNRKNKKGKLKKKKLKSKVMFIDVVQKHVLKKMDNPTDKQKKMLDAWLSN